MPVFAVLASIAVLSIPHKAIDFDRARDLDHEADPTGCAVGPAGYSILFESRPLVIFGLCVMLFHFANAPLLPLVGQKLAAVHPQEATAMMSFCIIAAQMVMLPIALLVGRTADSWGRKPLFLAGFAILPIRAALYTLSDNSFWLIGVQLLDGVGAGVFGALTPLVIADIMRGTGRYNLAQGAIATVQGIGASLSGLAVGRHRGSLRIQPGLSRVGRSCRGGPDGLCPRYAGNRRSGEFGGSLTPARMLLSARSRRRGACRLSAGVDGGTVARQLCDWGLWQMYTGFLIMS